MSTNLPEGLRIKNDQVVFPLSSCAVHVDQGRILLIRQVRAASAPSCTYELPGGSVDPGETPPQTAVRELLEEAGIVAEATSPALILDMDLDRSVHRTALVEVASAPQYAPGDGQATAEFAVEWVELTEAFEMIASGQISHAPTVVGILLQLLKHVER